MEAKKIILASTSPRRRELLALTGLSFEAVAGGYEEVMDGGVEPHELAKRLSFGKAESVARCRTGCLVIGADTFIVLDGELLGKPHIESRAVEMLRRLSGRAHSVMTGYTIIDSDTRESLSETVETRVHFKKLTEEEIAGYVESGEPLDKAGAYAIQGLGAALVEKIEGDYHNIIGLPLAALRRSLRKFGVKMEKSF